MAKGDKSFVPAITSVSEVAKEPLIFWIIELIYLFYDLWLLFTSPLQIWNLKHI